MTMVFPAGFRGGERDRLRHQRVGAERHVVAMLLDGSERQDHDRPVAVQRADLGRSQFFPAHRRTGVEVVKTTKGGAPLFAFEPSR